MCIIVENSTHFLKEETFLEIFRSHGSDYKNCCFLGCGVVSSGAALLTFLEKVMSPSSGCKSKTRVGKRGKHIGCGKGSRALRVGS
jgi:hypothetical protein